MKTGIIGRALLGVSALCLASSLAVAGPKTKLVGNWDLDVAKSTMNGQPAAKSGHVAITSEKNGITTVVDFVPATGATVHYEATLGLDGVTGPVTGNTYFDSADLVQVDSQTTIRTERRGGKVVGVTTIELSKDGKTIMSSSKGTLADGHQFTRSFVFTRSKKK
jgi:hypothetical protein